MAHQLLHRGIAQLVEQWSPKPRAEGSSPSAPASRESDIGFGNSISLFFFCTIFYDDIMFIIIMAGVSAVKAGIYSISKSRLVKSFLWI